jgi:hypothetical protein
MNIFLSWSGHVSQQVATVLRKWLPYMIHSVKPFMSSVDIRAGDRWSDDLSHELQGAQYGVVCVTPFNMHKPWMNFESGALAHLPTLSPFLFRVDRSALGHSPLTQFQLTEFGDNADRNKAEFFRLVESVNNSFAEQDRVEKDVLTKNFEHWWFELSKELAAIPHVSPGETRTAYKWLFTFEDLAIYDLKTECDVVWFVTADVFKYALRAGVRERMEGTIDKVRYRYLIPEPDRGNERAARDQLENLRRFRPDRIEYRCFKRDVFEKQATSDYVIVETSATDGGGIKAFVRIPIAETEQEYWFETEERAGIGFYHRFLQLWNSSDDVVASLEEGVKAALQSGAGLAT